MGKIIGIVILVIAVIITIVVIFNDNDTPTPTPATVTGEKNVVVSTSSDPSVTDHLVGLLELQTGVQYYLYCPIQYNKNDETEERVLEFTLTVEDKLDAIKIEQTGGQDTLNFRLDSSEQGGTQGVKTYTAEMAVKENQSVRLSFGFMADFMSEVANEFSSKVTLAVSGLKEGNGNIYDDTLKVRPNSNPPLATPNLEIERDNLKWDDISEAESYLCKVDDEGLEKLAACEYSISSLTVGDHTILINAEPGSTCKTLKASAPSTIHIKKLPSCTVTFEKDSQGICTLKWTAIEGCSKYRIYYKDESNNEIPVQTVQGTSYRLENGSLPAGSVTLYVEPTELGKTEDGRYLIPSRCQAPITLYQLPTPTIVLGVGQVEWTAVQGADKYEIYVDGVITDTVRNNTRWGLPTGLYGQAITVIARSSNATVIDSAVSNSVISDVH